METVIKTSGVTKLYGGKMAVKNVSMNIYRGDIYGFIGSNGAGKTTFIRCLMGLIGSEGKIEILGQTDKTGLAAARKKIGCIVENPALLLNQNALDCLKTHALLYGIKDEEKMNSLLRLVGLSDTGKKKIKDFSLGMRQRMAIAQALINDPEILILDEPTNGLDPQGIMEIRELLIDLSVKKSLTVLVSSHILAELQQLATRFGIIKEGELIDEFSKAELATKVRSTLTIKVSDLEKAAELIKAAVGAGGFEREQSAIGGGKAGNIKILDSDNYNAINRLLVKNDIDAEVVSKSQASLEEYFVAKVNGNSNGNISLRTSTTNDKNKGEGSNNA